MRGVMLVVMGLGFAWSAAAAEPPSSRLLGRLAEQEARIARSMEQDAYRVSGHVEELDGDGKLLHTRESVSRVTQRDGKKVVHVEQVRVDGKDVTEAERGKERDRKPRQLQSPFAAGVQAKYLYSLLGPDPANPRLQRLRFEPKPNERSSDTFVGEALVDPAAGEVVWMREHPAKNPAFVDRLEVEVALEATSPEGRRLSLLRIDGAGGMLFVKRGFRVRLQFSDYEPAPQAPRK